jgi:hypothetical protein
MPGTMATAGGVKATLPALIPSVIGVLLSQLSKPPSQIGSSIHSVEGRHARKRPK